MPTYRWRSLRTLGQPLTAHAGVLVLPDDCSVERKYSSWLGKLSNPLEQTIRRIKLLPNAEVATIDGDNHMLPLRSPNALGQLTGDLVRRHSNAA